jgi:DNA-binding NarL/FixJ family response regulator
VTEVGLVEDHELLADTLASALSSAGTSARVVPVRSAPEILADLRRDPVDLVLLDLDLGGLGDSTTMISALVDHGMRVLVVTGTDDPMRIAAALEQGAIGYQGKAAGFAALVSRVQSALAATVPLDAEHRVQLLEELRRRRARQRTALAPFDQLTEREAETLRALARGSSVAVIAREWVVSEATMRSHVRSILGKLGVSSQLAAVAAAVRVGWLREPDQAMLH